MDKDFENIVNSALNDKIFFSDEIKDARGQLDHLFFKINLLEVSIKNQRLEAKFNELIRMLSNTWPDPDATLLDKEYFETKCEWNESIEIMDKISQKIAAHLHNINKLRAKIKNWSEDVTLSAQLKELRDESVEIFTYTYENLIKGRNN